MDQEVWHLNLALHGDTATFSGNYGQSCLKFEELFLHLSCKGLFFIVMHNDFHNMCYSIPAF